MKVVVPLSLLVLALVGCAGPGQTASHAAAGASRPSDAASSPSASGRAQASTTDSSSPARESTFPCRLPVAYQAGASVPFDRLSPPRGAFITVPGGNVSVDPAGTTSWGSPDENSIDVVSAPSLHGNGGPSYSPTLGRWVPAPAKHVSPDRVAYAYAEPTTLPVGPRTENRIRVVQGATGAGRVYVTGGSKQPVAFDAAGVYLVEGRWEGSTVGLWKLDLASGAVQTIRKDGAWTVVGDGAAWGSAGSYGMGEPVERVDRLDLATGRTEQWLSRTGALLQVLGVDRHDRPLVQLNRLEASPETLVDVAVLEAPGKSRTLFSVPAGAPVTDMLADGHGVWFLTTTKVLLYREGSGLQEIITTSTGALGSRAVTSLAGACM